MQAHRVRRRRCARGRARACARAATARRRRCAAADCGRPRFSGSRVLELEHVDLAVGAAVVVDRGRAAERVGELGAAVAVLVHDPREGREVARRRDQPLDLGGQPLGALEEQLPTARRPRWVSCVEAGRRARSALRQQRRAASAPPRRARRSPGRAGRAPGRGSRRGRRSRRASVSRLLERRRRAGASPRRARARAPAVTASVSLPAATALPSCDRAVGERRGDGRRGRRRSCVEQLAGASRARARSASPCR